MPTSGRCTGTCTSVEPYRTIILIIAPQAQLFETAKDRVGPEALFKQVVNERHPDHVLSLDAQ